MNYEDKVYKLNMRIKIVLILLLVVGFVIISK